MLNHWAYAPFVGGWRLENDLQTQSSNAMHKYDMLKGCKVVQTT